MVDPNGMTIANSVQDLKECMLGQGIIADKLSSFGDVGEKIAFRAKFDDHKGTVTAIQYPYKGNHVGMLAGSDVQFDLSLLESPLPVVESGLA